MAFLAWIAKPELSILGDTPRIARFFSKFYSAGCVCLQVTRGQTNSLPRFFVTFNVITGQAHFGQACATGSFHSAYLQSG